MAEAVAPLDGPEEEKGADPLFEGNTASADAAHCFTSLRRPRVPVHSPLLDGHPVAASSAGYERSSLGNVNFTGRSGYGKPSPVAIEP